MVGYDFLSQRTTSTPANAELMMFSSLLGVLLITAIVLLTVWAIGRVTLGP
jgi:hypothetical protein